jgi:DNA gyrase subunit A
VVEHFLTCCDHDKVLFFSDRGVVYSYSAYQIPEASRTARGTPLVQMLPIPKGEKITSIVSVAEFTEDEYLIMLTLQGYIKKTALSAFSHIRSNGLIAISLSEGDQLRWVRLARSEDSIILASRLGMAIHFKADPTQLRPLGRATRGVRAMKLKGQDELISMDVLPSQIVAGIAMDGEEEDFDEAIEIEGLEIEGLETDEPDIDELDTDELETEGTETEELLTGDVSQGPWVLAITQGGFGKRVPVAQFRLQKRAGMGVKAIKFKSKTDRLASLHIVNEDDELMLVSNRGIIIRQAVNAISLQSRMATGVRVQRLDQDDAIAAVAPIPPAPEGDENEAEMGAEAE